MLPKKKKKKCLRESKAVTVIYALVSRNYAKTDFLNKKINQKE
jgi:hypothetical protein